MMERPARAKAIAALAGWAVQHGSPSRSDAEDIVSILGRVGGEDREWRAIVSRIRSAYEGGLSVAQFADQLGLRDGVSGYIYHSAPVAIYVWLVHGGDVERTVLSVLEGGGDTDTVGAIAGALAGAAGGEASIPNAWIDGIWDWPRGPWLLRELGDRLAEPNGSEGPVRY